MALTTQTRIGHRHREEHSVRDQERVLQAEAKRLREILDSVKAELERSDGPDPATSEPDSAAYRLEIVDLVERSQDRLGEVTDALGRLEDGIYGICEACSRPIPTARLEAIPESRVCVSCAATTKVQSASLLPFTSRRSNDSER